ncbi:VC0807 family protein [Streptomyces varsoviensis]|uniref:VC0807 family protein n=1 Tax=Streptomyces varsoviensis TaxID=67373 RepID=UPI0033F6AA9B
MTAARAGRPGARRRLLPQLIVDVGAPIALFYVLRGLGASTFAALLAGAVLPVATAGVYWLRDRRLEGMAAFMAVVMLLGLAVSLISGGTRFMLARDGWVTAAAGLCFLGSIRARRPLAYLGARPLLEGRFRSDGTPWEALWADEPAFRRIWRISTAIWGIALLADAIARIIISYTLPVDVVPGLGGLLWPVTMVLLQLVNGVYYRAAGLWRMTSGYGRRPAEAAAEAEAVSSAASVVSAVSTRRLRQRSDATSERSGGERSGGE